MVGLNFREFVESVDVKIYSSFGQNTVGTHNDAATATFLPSTWTGSEDLGRFGYGLPSVDLSIPSVTRKSKIRFVEKNRNPIIVQLMDGTCLYMTADEFRRIDARTKLDVDREITVVFQRRGDDRGQEPSQVVSIS